MTNETKYTADDARTALEHLDDLARMEVGVDAIGPRNVLTAFIDQAAQMMREREPVKVTDEDARCAALALCKYHDHELNEYWIAHYTLQARAALESFAARLSTGRAVPDGWKPVPVEPTIDMVLAFYDGKIELGHGGYVVPESCYKAMLAAAPHPEVTK